MSCFDVSSMANQRTIAVAWPRVDGQHVFHSGYERAVGLQCAEIARGIDQHCGAIGLLNTPTVMI